MNILSTAEAARLLGVSKSTVHRMARSGKLRVHTSNSAGDFFTEAAVRKAGSARRGAHDEAATPAEEAAPVS